MQKRPKRVQRKVNIERLPVVEEVFVKEVAYKCGITKDEVENKKVAMAQATIPKFETVIIHALHSENNPSSIG